MSIFISSIVSATFFLLYTDPGSGALLLQLLAASLLGGLFYFRKVRDKILKTVFGKKSRETEETALPEETK
jgi:hypothetical protein